MKNTTTSLAIRPDKLAHWAVILIAAIAFLVYGKSFLIPIILAVLLTVLLNALRTALMYPKIANVSLGKRSATAVAILLLLLINYIVVMILSSQLDAFKEYIPIYENNLERLLSNLFQLSTSNAMTSIEHFANKVELAGILSWVGDSLSLVVSNVFLTLLYTAFLFSEEAKIPLKLSQLKSEPQKSEQIKELCQNISWSIQKYIGMKTVISLITALASYFVLLAFDVHFAALWALIIFFLNFIPNIGSIFGVIFPSLLTLLQFDTLTPFFMVTTCLVTVQFIIGNVLEPTYLGRSLNLSSFVVLISLSFWGAIWDLVGMFLSVPLLVVTSLVCQHIKGLQWISILFSADGHFMDNNNPGNSK